LEIRKVDEQGDKENVAPIELRYIILIASSTLD